MKILADKDIPYLKGVAEQIGDVDYLPGIEFSNENINGYDVLIIRTVTPVDEHLLKGTSVKLVCSATIGYDHIDTDYCNRNNIAWRNAPGCNADSVEQYITSSLICLASKYDFSLNDKTIGIIGVGNVGTRVASVCNLLGMNVLLNDPPREDAEGGECFVSLNEIRSKSDFISFHVPLNREGNFPTYHLADFSFFESLSRCPYIINSCRGSVVDCLALKEAIKTKKISGTVIDCWENEPAIDRELLELCDIATPHIAGYSADGKSNASHISMRHICDFYGLNYNELIFSEIEPALNPLINILDYPENEKIFAPILHTYSPIKETIELKNSPDEFADFRSNYPLRREYGAYTIVNCSNDEKNFFEKLRFKVYNTSK